MNTSTTANVARAAFVMITTLLGISIALGQGSNFGWIGALSGLFFGLLVLLVDIGLRNFSIKGFSTGTFGLLIGLLCAWLITRIGIFNAGWIQDFGLVKEIAELCLYLGFGFIGMMLAIRSKRDEFSLVIPYVRFRQESVQEAPLLVDSNVIIDGRIPQICETGFLGGSLVVPRFVLDELQLLGDSSDSAKRQKGKRGLACLEEMQGSPSLDVVIHEEEIVSESTVDGKLIALGRLLGARILTNDSGLAKVARLQNSNVLNLNELADSLKSSLNKGDELDLELVKEGKDEHQAVGYLEDGTMIVVNRARELIGTRQSVTIGSSLQTNAGRLIFAELNSR